MKVILQNMSAILLPLALLSGCRRDHSSDLYSTDPSMRKAALDRIAGTTEAAASIPALIDCLRDNDSVVREKAVLALYQVGSPATQNLLDACKDRDPRVRSGAILAFCPPTPKYDETFNPADKERIFPVFLTLLSDEDATVRSSAARAVPCLKTSAKRDAAIWALLTRSLKDPSKNVRYWSAHAIGIVASEERDRKQLLEAISGLARLQRDPDERIRETALWALGKMVSAADDAIPILVEALTDRNSLARTQSIESLANLRDGGLVSIPLLTRAFREFRYRGCREEVLIALRRLHPLPREVVPIFVEGLDDPSTAVRHVAVLALGEMGPTAREAVSALKNLLSVEQSPEVRVCLAWSIARIDDRCVQDSNVILQHALHHEDARVREAAANALGDTGTCTESLIMALNDLSQHDTDARVRQAARSASRSIRGKSSRENNGIQKGRGGKERGGD